MPEEEEIQEKVKEAKEPFDKIVAGTMAIIAALLAVVTVLGQHFNTEELLRQQQASDQWAFSQAKDIRRYSAEIGADTLAIVKGDPKIVAKYAKDSAKYKQQHDEIQDKARDFEKERDREGDRANRFHIGEVFLEAAIVFSSLSILTRTRLIFFGGVIFALLGIGVSVSAWFA